jgi:glycosyltransferase involved in cell wall biosynthesis
MQKEMTTEQTRRLHYAGTPGEGFGWGTCNTNLLRELKRTMFAGRVELCGPDNADVVFMPLADHDFNPITPARGKINLAYTFFEYPLGLNAAVNAAKYDVVFAGSTWCMERMRERGIANTKLLIQGVDRDIFKATPPRAFDGQFRIFSGGKFEYRKGQDLVIAAFAQFIKERSESIEYPEAHLVCSWFNPWPQLIQTVWLSPFIKTPAITNAARKEDIFSDTLRRNGLRSEQFTILPQLPQARLAAEMANTDVGLFPNRCEGGTNLVLMEYASCGRKVIANVATGHHDIAPAVSYRLHTTEDSNHWAVHTIDDIVSKLEQAFESRFEREHWSMSPYRCEWTWAAAAEKILQECR